MNEVVLRCTADIAPQLMRKQWHSSQQVKKLPDGGLELTFQVSNVDGLITWVLGWVPHIEVLKPKSFRKEIHDSLAEGANMNS
jgi:predicted DNA-binding transcriptional regulator YafY